MPSLLWTALNTRWTNLFALGGNELRSSPRHSCFASFFYGRAPSSGMRVKNVLACCLLYSVRTDGDACIVCWSQMVCDLITVVASLLLRKNHSSCINDVWDGDTAESDEDIGLHPFTGENSDGADKAACGVIYHWSTVRAHPLQFRLQNTAAERS
ncbi:hypothetical protein KIN20_022795 [Parelaphostrongylus tenuis]|uniref:Uncharacterized protein n=1 Tax=Parelaphostrongylus tenuis TaxID=148309 RepID=A0AAD5QV13_PARTN|nr:hypothetical protein KIN20_022795 [Parelaphostrongylus tenuis]